MLYIAALMALYDGALHLAGLWLGAPALDAWFAGSSLPWPVRQALWPSFAMPADYQAFWAGWHLSIAWLVVAGR